MSSNWLVSTIAGIGAVGGSYLTATGDFAMCKDPDGIALDAGGTVDGPLERLFKILPGP